MRSDPQQELGGGRFDDYALAREMVRERLARRASAFEACDGRGPRHVQGFNLVFGGDRLELFELQLHLVDQPGSAFRAVAIALTPEFGDLQLQMLDHRFRSRDHRPGLRQLALGSLGAGLRSGKRGAQSGDVGGGIWHGQSLPCEHAYTQQNKDLSAAYPAFVRRCVQRGFRQSIPSMR